MRAFFDQRGCVRAFKLVGCTTIVLVNSRSHCAVHQDNYVISARTKACIYPNILINMLLLDINLDVSLR